MFPIKYGIEALSAWITHNISTPITAWKYWKSPDKTLLLPNKSWAPPRTCNRSPQPVPNLGDTYRSGCSGCSCRMVRRSPPAVENHPFDHECVLSPPTCYWNPSNCRRHRFWCPRVAECYRKFNFKS